MGNIELVGDDLRRRDERLSERLARLVTALERLREDVPGTADDAIRGRLTHAGNLVKLLDDLRVDLDALAPASEWTDLDAAVARVALEVYDRAVRELRAVALDARGRIERAQQVFEEASLLAHRRRRRMERRASRAASPRS